jgi:DNA-binding PadR family transcriptional regulator
MESPLSTRAVLLQALDEASGYGSEIMARVKLKTGGQLVLHSGSVYPALHSMAEEGLIKRRKIKIEADVRTYLYELTNEGRKIAAEHRMLARIVFEGEKNGTPAVLSGF